MNNMIEWFKSNKKIINIALIAIGLILTVLFSNYDETTSLIEVVLGGIGAIFLLGGILLFVKSLFDK